MGDAGDGDYLNGGDVMLCGKHGRVERGADGRCSWCSDWAAEAKAKEGAVRVETGWVDIDADSAKKMVRVIDGIYDMGDFGELKKWAGSVVGGRSGKFGGLAAACEGIYDDLPVKQTHPDRMDGMVGYIVSGGSKWRRHELRLLGYTFSATTSGHFLANTVPESAVRAHFGGRAGSWTDPLGRATKENDREQQPIIVRWK
jgi:hypothetical protein